MDYMQFRRHFGDLVVDSDYSAHPSLQGLTLQDIGATADAVWICLPSEPREREAAIKAMTPATVVGDLRALRKRYEDVNHLAETEFQEFWDQVDEQGLSLATQDDIARELAVNFLADQKRQGCVIVDNTEGIFVFDFADRSPE